MRETDLYPPVKRFLERQGYEVKAEIGECDVVARRGDEPPVIVELKARISLQLVLQGVDRQAMTDAVYLCVAAPKRRETADIAKLCRRLGLGLLTVHRGFVEALADPAPYRPRKDVRRTGLLLKEFAHRVGDPNEGGAARRRPLMTAYRQDALRCARHLGRDGPTKLAALRAATGVARASGILQDDVYGWFTRVERGVYALTPKGEAALGEFAAALAHI
ncbi:MAG: hypothetical protein JNK46_02935 [Methylobacteriaceae bacterium]|nr:hypothetical protein [Methylobacteriaceae bacterium]